VSLRTLCVHSSEGEFEESHTCVFVCVCVCLCVCPIIRACFIMVDGYIVTATNLSNSSSSSSTSSSSSSSMSRSSSAVCLPLFFGNTIVHLA